MGRSKDIKNFIEDLMDDMESAKNDMVQDAQLDELCGLLGRTYRKLVAEGFSEEGAIRIMEKMLEVSKMM
jgi:hypothetical protein